MATQEAVLTAPRSSILDRALGLVLKGGIALITGVIVAVVAGASLPSLFGYHPMVVTSGSMTPGIQVGDVVLIKDIPADQIAVGDIITFTQQDGEGMTTHRVHSLKEIDGDTWIQTKGDANADPDPDLTSAKAVYGKVHRQIPAIGPAMLFAATPRGKLVLLGIPALLMVFSELGRFMSQLRARKSDAEPA
jgi:signal peptidase